MDSLQLMPPALVPPPPLPAVPPPIPVLPLPATSPPAPQVNDGYWFSYSRTLVDGALKARDEAAEKLQGFITWLWTVYTAGVVLGLNLGKLNLDTVPAVFLGVPILALIIAYWLALRVRIPVIASFDPRAPQSIGNAYEHNLRLKQHRLLIALAVTVGSGVFVALSIVYASIATSGARVPSLYGELKKLPSGLILFVSGSIPEATTATMEVRGSDVEGGDVLSRQRLAFNRGQFQADPIEVRQQPVKPLTIVVTAEGSFGGQIVFTREVAELPKGATGGVSAGR